MQRVRLAIPAGLLFCILVGLSRTSGQGPGGSAIGFAAQIPPPPIVTPTASQQIVNDTGSIASDLYLLAGVDGNDRLDVRVSLVTNAPHCPPALATQYPSVGIVRL